MTALIILGLIIGTPLIAAGVVKKKYRVAREIIIDSPASEVYNYLRFLKNQENFSKWVQTDPAMKKTFRGTDGSVGSVYGWDGNKKAGEGEQEINGLSENKKIDIEIRFVRPFKNVAQTPFTLESVSPAKTKVTWEMLGENAYPMTLMNFFVDKLLGPDMENSLNQLKFILEKQKVQVK